MKAETQPSLVFQLIQLIRRHLALQGDVCWLPFLYHYTITCECACAVIAYTCISRGLLLTGFLTAAGGPLGMVVLLAAGNPLVMGSNPPLNPFVSCVFTFSLFRTKDLVEHGNYRWSPSEGNTLTRGVYRISVGVFKSIHWWMWFDFHCRTVGSSAEWNIMPAGVWER